MDQSGAVRARNAASVLRKTRKDGAEGNEENKETEAEDHAGVRRSPRWKQLRPAVHDSPRSAEARAGRREDDDGAGPSTSGRWEGN
eukprot:361525-Chlamydomonas_euryale.AAC.1